ncbi:hypothetical protein MW887_007728 [Aspergillus wentii]|nr:hypothetical protein MW887_007728 [Aspergillus wentii]
MSSHHIAIAKASFSAGLLRPDPTSVPRDEITAFHTSFDRTLSHCSPANIQTCKSWLLNYVISSSNRVGVWAKYLVALSGSFTPVEDGKQPTPAGATRVSLSPKRKRLHILYLLNDLFHHTKYHLDSTAAFSTLSGSLQPYIVELLGYAASYDREKHPKHHRRLDDLLEIWADHGYYGADYVDKLREVVKSSALSGPVKTSIGVEENNTESTKKFTGKDAPFIMPSTHGDPSTPYYDLPAGNLVPHIIPDSTVPLRPDSIRPLQFLAGPADAKLVAALKTFMKDVDRIYGPGKPEKNEEDVIDIDDLGQTVIRDGITGDILNGETYYGWSRTFCQQMKKRNQTRDSATIADAPDPDPDLADEIILDREVVPVDAHAPIPHAGRPLHDLLSLLLTNHNTNNTYLHQGSLYHHLHLSISHRVVALHRMGSIPTWSQVLPPHLHQTTKAPGHHSHPHRCRQWAFHQA